VLRCPATHFKTLQNGTLRCASPNSFRRVCVCLYHISNVRFHFFLPNGEIRKKRLFSSEKGRVACVLSYKFLNSGPAESGNKGWRSAPRRNYCRCCINAAPFQEHVCTEMSGSDLVRHRLKAVGIPRGKKVPAVGGRVVHRGCVVSTLYVCHMVYFFHQMTSRTSWAGFSANAEKDSTEDSCCRAVHNPTTNVR